MNLTAHPLTVAAELSWKQESLGHANLAGRRRAHEQSRGQSRHGWHLPSALRRPARPRPTHRPRPA
jgi:hypothetical protein